MQVCVSGGVNRTKLARVTGRVSPLPDPSLFPLVRPCCWLLERTFVGPACLVQRRMIIVPTCLGLRCETPYSVTSFAHTLILTPVPCPPSDLSYEGRSE